MLADEAAIVLVDFLGQPQAEWRGPTPQQRRDGAAEAVLDAMQAMLSRLYAGQVTRLQGLGIAMSAPKLMEIGEPGLDALAAGMEERLRLPTYIQDEAVAACSAELVHGLG